MNTSRWAPALIAVAAVACAGVIFVSGLVAGVFIGRGMGSGDTTTPASPAGPATPDPQPEPGNGGSGSNGGGDGNGGDGGGNDDGSTDDGQAAPPAGGGSIDECLVGQWRSTDHEETYQTEQGVVNIDGLVREVEIDSSGQQTITYDNAQADLALDGNPGTITFNGTVVYQASTSGSTMSFQLLSSEGDITISVPGAPDQQEDLTPGTGSVTYTCDDTTFTQDAQGFRAAYERVG